MTVWIFRAGRMGEYEAKYLDDKKIYCVWDLLNTDLSKLKTKEDLKRYMCQQYPDAKINTIRNWAGQVYDFYHEMNIGDTIVTPSKSSPIIHFGVIKSEYEYHPEIQAPYQHSRKVYWEKDMPRSSFPQDILYSFGAFMTVCKIKQEKRIAEILSGTTTLAKKTVDIEKEVPDQKDVEADAFEEISQFIIQKFKGHGMEHLIDAILRAEGYTTHLSPEGADGGVDILASKGSLGFDGPCICVQVKTTDGLVGSEVLSQLKGTMSTMKADHGLLIGWNGFKNSVLKETASNFFGIRLWTNKEVIEALINNYEKMDSSIKEQIPFKKYMGTR